MNQMIRNGTAVAVNTWATWRRGVVLGAWQNADGSVERYMVQLDGESYHTGTYLPADVSPS